MDVAALEAEHERYIKLIKDDKAAILSLYDAIKSYRGSDIKTITAETEKLNTSLQKSKKVSDDVAAAREREQKANDKVKKSTQALTLEKAKEQEQTKRTNAEIRNQAKAALAAENTLEKLKITLVQMNARKDKLNIDSKEYKQAEKDVLELTNKIKQLEANSGDFRRNVGNYSGAVKTLEAALVEVKGKLDQMTASGTTNEEQTKELKREYDLLTQIVGKQAQGFVSMRNEIKQNQMAIEQLSLVYGEDSEIVRALILENGKLRDSYGDLIATQKALGSDTFVFDGILQAGQALVGVYGAATSAAALFGGENEELQKSVQKMMAVLTLVQSVQAVVNALQKEGAAIQLLLAIRTKATAAAQAVYTFVTGGAAAATTALGISMRALLVSTGLAGLLVLLPLVANGMNLFSSETKKAGQDVNDLEGYISSLSEGFDELSKAVERNTKRQVETAKLRGKSTADIITIEQRGLAEQLDILKAKDKALEQEYNRGNKSAADLAKISKERLGLISEIADTELDIQLKTLEKTNAINEANLKLQERNNQAQFDIIRMRLEATSEANKKIADDEEAFVGNRLTALSKYYTDQKSIIEAEEKFALSQKGLTSKEKEKISVQAELRAAALLIAYSDQRKAIIKRITEEEKEEFKAVMEAFTFDPNAQADLVEKNTRDALGSLLGGTNDAEYTERVNKLTNRLKDGLITYEQYQKERQDLDDEYSLRALNNETELIDALIKNLSSLPNKTEEQEKKILELKRLYAEKKRQIYDQEANDEIKSSKKSAEERIKTINEVLFYQQQAFQLAQGLSNAAFQGELNRLQTLKDENDTYYAREIENINNSSLSEQEKAARTTLLRDTQEQKDREIERKKREAQNKQAQFEKKLALFQILINTSAAVIKALIDPGGLAGLALSIQAGVAGAVQFAVAAATPVPKYEKGGRAKKGTIALTDEKGPELYVKSDGSMYMGNNQPTLRNFTEDTQIIPADKVNQYLYNHMLKQTAAGLQSGNNDDKIGSKIETLNASIQNQTNVLRKEISRSRKKTTINNTINTGWATYIQRKTFN